MPFYSLGEGDKLTPSSGELFRSCFCYVLFLSETQLMLTLPSSVKFNIDDVSLDYA